jgi:4-amino-4-deoxy-L-arabinose transferase-like glycosyltransferase
MDAFFPTIAGPLADADSSSGSLGGTVDVLDRPSPVTNPRRSERRDLVRTFLVLLALTFALRVPAFFVPVFNSDETFLATQAHVISDGGHLYEQAADRKPPLVPYVYAATFAFFDTSALWSIRMVAMLAVAITALLLAVEARRRYGRRAGWIAGILFIGAMVAFAPQDGQAANFEVFMLPSMTAAILFARRGRGVAAGVMVALATLAKQTGAATLLPVLYLLARARGKRGVGEVAFGFTVPTALVALAIGPSQLLYWVVIGNGSYLGMNTVSTTVITTFLFMSAMWAVCNLPLLWRLPVAWRNRRTKSLDGRTDTDLWLWVVSAAISTAIGLRFFGHYYMQLVPPIALLASGALVRSSARIAKIGVASACVLAVGFSAAGYFIHPGEPEPQYRSVSEYLASMAGPDDAIFVWGSVPEIYWASGKRPATRFLTQSFLTGNYPGRPSDDPTVDDTTRQACTDFYQDFAKSPPQYLVDTSPAAVRGSGYYPISKFPRLDAIVHQAYRYVVTIDGYDIYRRR